MAKKLGLLIRDSMLKQITDGQPIAQFNYIQLVISGGGPSSDDYGRHAISWQSPDNGERVQDGDITFSYTAETQTDVEQHTITGFKFYSDDSTESVLGEGEFVEEEPVEMSLDDTINITVSGITVALDEEGS